MGLQESRVSGEVVVFGLLGVTLDAGEGPERWEKWRPTVSLAQDSELSLKRVELIYPSTYKQLAEQVKQDIEEISPGSEVCITAIDFSDPWNLEQVYGGLFDFANNYAFKPEEENYLIHITTGTHIAQICLFLLTEAHYFPGRLIQTSPPKREEPGKLGSYTIIDLDLSKYDQIASRFRKERQDSVSFLKYNIDTKSETFNNLIEHLEKIVLRSKDPVLFTGPTGAGKTRLAERVYELKKNRRLVDGDFVAVNCATLRGDAAMSTLFGHVKGAFTGAVNDRPGLLKKANKGVLFLDEIGALGLDEQAMLLRAIELKRFFPVGSDREVSSEFQLIAGTNQDLEKEIREGRFREDLLARINLWSFELPSLSKRREDIEPNIDYELERFSNRTGIHVTFSKQARAKYLQFALGRDATWTRNFRDLTASVTRMATLADGGRITEEVVEKEQELLQRLWRDQRSDSEELRSEAVLETVLGGEAVEELDLFDRVQLSKVIEICKDARSLSDAGRSLFAQSRIKKKAANDADRLSKYLSKFGIHWNDLQ